MLRPRSGTELIVDEPFDRRPGLGIALFIQQGSPSAHRVSLTSRLRQRSEMSPEPIAAPTYISATITSMSIAVNVLIGVLVLVVAAIVFEGWRRLRVWWKRRPRRSNPTIY